MAFFNWWLSAEDGNGTEIKGILALVNSAKIEELDLVIAKLIFEKNLSRLSLKLKISKSIFDFL